MKKILLGFLVVMFCCVINAQSQTKLNKQLFERDMVDAELILAKRIDKGDSTVFAQYAYVLQRLNKSKEAFKNYSIAANKGTLIEKQHLLDYVSLCKQNNLNQSAYKPFILKLRELGFSLSENQTEESINNLAEISNSCVNSNADEFGLTSLDGIRLLSSNRLSTDENVQNAFMQTFAINNKCDVVVKNITPELRRYHTGPVHSTANGKYIFVTVSRTKKNKSGIYQLEILWSKKVDGGYSAYTSLPFCSPDYSVQHAFFDDASGMLFFSSDMKGGRGGFDIYYTKLNDSGWDAPKPLTTVNTSADEVFPTISNGDLFYSSTPANGFGGLDILMLVKGSQTPVILSAPINSSYDDFYFQPISKINGTFTSNRVGGKGGDDIYDYAIDTTPYTVCIELKDSTTQLPNKDVVVSYTFGNKTYTSISDEKGLVCFNIPATSKLIGTDLSITLKKGGYNPLSFQVPLTFDKNRKLEVLKLMPVIPVVVAKAKIKVGQDLGKLLNLNPIYFDLGKWDVRSDASIELDKIVSAMNEFPTLVIELGSHTDSRSSAKFNQTLSQKRAESSGQYILSKGIAPKRLTWKGYGESKLLNKCKDGVKCSEDDHAKNRRTEFKIIKM
jgi:outer membrane protein OmpA-like peptidoglycan-associated protein